MLPSSLSSVVHDRSLTGEALAGVLRTHGAELIRAPRSAPVADAEGWPPPGLPVTAGADGPLTTFQLPFAPGSPHREVTAASIGAWWLFLADVIVAATSVGFTLERPQANALTFVRADSPFFSRRHLKRPMATGAGFDARPLYRQGASSLLYARLDTAPASVFAVAVMSGAAPFALLAREHATEVIDYLRPGCPLLLRSDGIHLTNDIWGPLQLDPSCADPWRWTVPQAPAT